GGNRVEEVAVEESLDVAVALQAMLVEVHRPRDVYRQHQFEIDVTLRRVRRRRQGQQQEKGEPPHAPTSRVFASSALHGRVAYRHVRSRVVMQEGGGGVAVPRAATG